jgi:hypothetical protein
VEVVLVEVVKYQNFTWRVKPEFNMATNVLILTR